MAKQTVFNRSNIDEFLNEDKNYYTASGTRRVGLHDVSFTYTNSLQGGNKATHRHMKGETMNKQEFIKVFSNAVAATGAYAGVELSADETTAYLICNNGYRYAVNVNMDSCAAIIADVSKEMMRH